MRRLDPKNKNGVSFSDRCTPFADLVSTDGDMPSWKILLNNDTTPQLQKSAHVNAPTPTIQFTYRIYIYICTVAVSGAHSHSLTISQNYA